MRRQPVTALLMHPVVAAEFFTAAQNERLQRCCELVTDTPVRELAAIPEPHRVEVLITSWGCPALDPLSLKDFANLKLIAHLGGSVKGFIDERLWDHGILVGNTVAANAVPVAEYVLAAILFANKRVFHLQQFYREHHENRAPWTREAPDVGNYGKTIGIVGASSVGRKVIELLRPFDLNVLLYDPWVSIKEALAMGTRRTELNNLLQDSDVVSLHVPLLPETEGMIGAAELARMKQGATLINTARGAIVDQSALIKVLQQGQLHAVLDTTTPEVLPADSPLYELPNVLLTPHIAGSLGNEVHRLTEQILTELELFARSRPMTFLVERAALPRLG